MLYIRTIAVRRLKRKIYFKKKWIELLLSYIPALNKGEKWQRESKYISKQGKIRQGLFIYFIYPYCMYMQGLLKKKLYKMVKLTISRE